MKNLKPDQTNKAINMNKKNLYLVCVRVRKGYEGIVRDDLAYIYNTPAEEAIEIMNHLNNLPNPHPGYRYVLQKQRKKYVSQMGRIYSDITADPIRQYSDQFFPPYTHPLP